MIFFKNDIDRILNTIHNSGFVRSETYHARMDVFDKMVRLKGSTCYYFTERGYVQPRSDFLQLPDVKKTFKIRIDLYKNGDARVSALRVSASGATRCLVVDDLDAEEEVEVRLFRTLVKNGVI